MKRTPPPPRSPAPAASPSPSLVGHEKVWDALQTAVAGDRLPHALLFTGPEGVGKRTLAVALARQLVVGEDAEEAVRFSLQANERYLLYSDLTKPLPVRRAELLTRERSEDQLLSAYGLLEREGWLGGIDDARGPDVIDLLERNPERFTGRRGIPFADVLERELAGLERVRDSSPDVVAVARRLFTQGPSLALYRRNLGIELINGRGDGAHFRTIESLLHTTVGGERRVVIVDDAHKMTEEAENAFLKTLEEPPPGTLIVLVTAEPLLLLPTTLSRCAHVVFGPVPEVKLAEFLVENQKRTPDEARLLATLADGSIGAALAARGLDLVQRRREVEALLPAIARSDLGEVLAIVGQRLTAAAEGKGGGRGGGRDALRVESHLLIDLLALCFRDLVLLSTADAEIALVSGMDPAGAAELAGQLSASEWERLYLRTQEAARDVEASVEPRLAIEALFAEALDPKTVAR